MSTKIIPARADGGQLVTSAANQVPDFLRNVENDNSTALLKTFVTPPRIKRVQKSSREQFIPRFAPGDMVALPLMEKLAGFTDGKQPAFFFTPVMMWPEWICWNPLETQGTLPGIRDRTFDSKSPIAIKARDKNKRKAERCPELPSKNGKDLFLNYVEHLNYIFMIDGDGPGRGVPIAYSFERGEHFAGTTFNALVGTRGAPLWGCRFQAVIRSRKNADGDWYGLDMENPSEGSAWIDPTQAQRMEAIHKEFLKNYEEQLLRVDYDDEMLNEEKPADARDM